MTSVSIVPAAAELVTRLTEAADVPHLPARVAAPVRVRVNFLAGCRHLRWLAERARSRHRRCPV